MVQDNAIRKSIRLLWSARAALGVRCAPRQQLLRTQINRRPKMAFALDRSPLSEETKKIAEEELRETPEVVKKALEELRELLENDQSIYFATDDETLIIFLRPCKFYAKSAYELVSRGCLVGRMCLRI